MDEAGEERHYNEVQATGASKEHVVRWVLGISLLLVVALLSAVWIFGSLTK